MDKSISGKAETPSFSSQFGGYLENSAARSEDFEAPTRLPEIDVNTMKAVFFDLDGTLLQMDLDDFLERYFKEIISFAVERGADPESFSKGFGAGVKAMASNDGSKTNKEAFWGAFYQIVARSDVDWETITDEYYDQDFDKIGQNVVKNPYADKLVKTFADKGYIVVVATMPMFPLEAVKKRLAWAGVDSAHFELMTSYETSTSVKPHTSYFQEILDRLGLDAKEALMIGNNTVEDLAASKIGIQTFIATDFLLNPAKINMNDVAHGTLEEIASWADSLEPCAQSH